MALNDKEKLLRNSFYGGGKYGIPVIYKQDVDLQNIELIGFHNIKPHDEKNSKNKTVHFFIDDIKFDCIFNDPESYLTKLVQYKQIIGLDLSVFSDMPPWRQIENIARSYYCGAYWQSLGLKVIATATWSNSDSFEYCFDGIDKDAVVAVSTMQTKKGSKNQFMKGFRELCKRKSPPHIICYGKPYPEMSQEAQISYVRHEGNVKRKKLRQYFPDQPELFDCIPEKIVS